MTFSPKVSILVPIYNVEKYLEECLDSVVNQTLKEIEIICINDGSTDNSLKIVEKYAQEDSRVVIVDKKNSGYGDSMNRGLEKATGEYIGIVESDDWIELNAFEKLYKLAKKNNAEVVKSNYYGYFTDPAKTRQSGKIVELVHPGEVGRVIDPAAHPHIFFQRPAIWTGIYRKEFLNRNEIRFMPTPGASYQDTGFNFKIWASARRVVFTKEAFLHYRQDNENSSVNSPGKVFCISDEYAEIEKYLSEKELLSKFGELMRVAKWGAYHWNIDRLTVDLAAEFIQAASKEYKRDRDKGIFNFEFCDVNQVRAINELIENPEMFIKRKSAAEAAKVSVIVPVYNLERRLRKSLDSVVGQTFKDIEIILVDDGSIDDSTDILEEYYDKDPRVRLISQNNRGQSSARNRGIEQAHAEYITFSDGDDYYELDALKSLYGAISKSGADTAVGSIRIIYEDKRFTAMEKNGDRQYYTVKFRGEQSITDSLMRKVDVSPCNKIFRKSIIIEHDIRFPEGLRYEDAYFFYAYAWSSQRAFFLPPDKYVYNYVRRPGSTMAQTFRRSLLAYDHIEIAIRLFEFLKDSNSLKRHSTYFTELFESYYNLSFNYMPSDQHGRLFSRVRHFIAQNARYLDQVDPKIRPRLSGLVPKTSLVVGMKSKAKNVTKRAAAKILPKISLSYRSQRHMLSAMADLRREIDQAGVHASRISKISDDLETLKISVSKNNSKA